MRDAPMLMQARDHAGQSRRFLRDLPVLLHERFGAWVLLPFALVTAGAVLALPRIRVNATIQVSLEIEDAYERDRQEMERRFAPSDYVLIAVPAPDPFDPGTLSVVERVSSRVASAPGVSTVLSITTATEAVVEGEELISRPLYRAAQDATLPERVAANPLLLRFLLSPDRGALSIWVFPEPGTPNRAFVGTLERIVREETHGEPILFGERAVQYWTEQAIVRDATRLGPLCVLVVLVALCLVGGSLRVGLLLWLGSLLPTLWILGLCALLEVEISLWNLMVPFEVLALSTSYGIHLVRNLHARAAADLPGALRFTTSVVGWAGFTTALGFASLLLSPLAELRVMGTLLVTGIGFSLGCALFLLPALLRHSSGLGIAPRAGRGPRIRRPRGRSTRAWPLAFLGIALCLAAGIPLLGTDFRYGLFLGDNTITGHSLAFVQRHYGGLYELDLIVDTGVQYGLTDPQTFNGIQDLERTIRDLPGVDDVVSIAPFVDWLSGVLGQPSREASEQSIGESLELLGGLNPGVRIDTLVDRDYQSARLVVRFDPRRLRPRQTEHLVLELSSQIREAATRSLPGMTSVVLGYPLEARRVVDYVQRGQLRGSLIYLAVVLVLVSSLLRSVRWGMVAVLPPLVGLGAYFGLMGWLGLPLSALASMVAAVVMGVGVDDVLCLLVTYRGSELPSGTAQRVTEALRRALRPIVETTLVIVAGLAVLLLSVSPLLRQAGLQIAAALTAATVTTVVVVPGAIRLLFRLRR